MGVVRVSSEREEPKACVQITGANTGMELLCVGEREEGERREMCYVCGVCICV